MAVIDLHKAYDSEGSSLAQFFGRTEEGFFIPPYQREYTWEQDNVSQLFDDIVFGITDLSRNQAQNVATFLGTTILTLLPDKTPCVVPGEKNAQPSAVQLVIDGQQRIATVGLIAIQLEVLISDCQNNVPNNDFPELHNHATDLISELSDLYSLKLGRGSKPPRKPKTKIPTP